MSYLTYTEYKDMGGTLDEVAFNLLLVDVESKVNYLTNGRIKNIDPIPQAVKMLIFKLICFYSTNNQGVKENGLNPNITSYSNGIESFSFSYDSSASFDNKIISMMKEYLWEYPELLYRGRKQWKQKL